MAEHHYRIAVFASGRGTNAERLFSCFAHHPRIRVGLLISSGSRALVLEKAKKFAVPTRVINATALNHADVVLQVLAEQGITHLVLAGFLWLLPASIVHTYRHRIINIHPSLLPQYGGKGMYGIHVHRAVKQAGEKETGITIHSVNEYYDEGKILFQKRCKIDSADTVDAIANKVQQLEHNYYPRVVEKWIKGVNTWN